MKQNPPDPGAAGRTRRLSLIADPQRSPLPALLLVLTVVTGLVDAVSILSLGRVFVANMTGNMVFVGFALASAPGFSLSASLSALAGFLLGAAASGIPIDRLGAPRGAQQRAGSAGELGLLGLALTVVVLAGPSPVPAREPLWPPSPRSRWACRTPPCAGSPSRT